MTPHARSDQLVLQEVGADLVIYDQQTHRAHCLNASAAAIYRACDGQRSLAAIAQLTGEQEATVELAVQQMVAAELVEAKGLTLRPAAVALAVGAGMLLPMVESMLAPTPAAAGSF